VNKLIGINPPASLRGMTQLTQTQIADIVKTTKENDRLLSNEIMRAGGDRDDYLAAYDLLTFGRSQ